MQSATWTKGRSTDPDPGGGQDPGKFSYVEEGLYAHDDTVVSVTVDDKIYRVQQVDRELCKENAY